MSDPQRQKRLLAVLLVVLAAAIAYRALEGSGGGRVGRSSRQLASAEQLAALSMPHLDLEALQRDSATFSPGRDPFRYGAAPAPPPPPQPSPRPNRQRARKARETPAPKPQPAQTPPKRRPPEVDFVYLGSFGPGERRIAVFSKGDEIYNALVGDVLLGRFIVDKIGFESADIKFVGFPDEPETRLAAGG